MECPSCGKQLDDGVIFCTNCGTKLPEIIKRQIHEEMKAAFDELSPIESEKILPTPHQNIEMEHKSKSEDQENLTYETDDVRKIEYKSLLKEVFADRHITAEEIVNLAKKVKELGLDKNEAQNIQADVAKELKIDIDEEGDLISSDIVLEVNTNKGYVENEMDNLEIRVTNIANDNVEKTFISCHLMNLRTVEKKDIGTIKSTQKRVSTLPFTHNRRGNETVEVFLNYFDTKGNPSVYKTEFQVKVLSREEEQRGAKSINITFTAEKIMGNDFSNMAEIFEKDKKQVPERKTSYEEIEKQWRRLPVFFDEDETNRRREEVIINRKLREGRDKVEEALEIKQDAEKIYLQNKRVAIEQFKNAFNLFKESEECFQKVREINPEHTGALEEAKNVRRTIKEIEGKIGVLGQEPTMPSLKPTSGCLTVTTLQKKVFIYSKDRIVLGRNSDNNIVLRLIPYHPKEQYPENYQKTSQISGTHAEIINRTGNFYIRDIGTNNSGSANGTFIDGKRLKPVEECILKDGMRINIARVLELECIFLGDVRKSKGVSDSISGCQTVLGDTSDSCFGIDKKGTVDAIKLKRRNNYTEGEKYIILIREMTVGRSPSNGIVIDNESVSDIHAKVFFRDNQYWIEDLNSRYGTWVNDKKIEPGNEVSLNKQAEIILGNVQLTFQGFV